MLIVVSITFKFTRYDMQKWNFLCLQIIVHIRYKRINHIFKKNIFLIWNIETDRNKSLHFNHNINGMLTYIFDITNQKLKKYIEKSFKILLNKLISQDVNPIHINYFSMVHIINRWFFWLCSFLYFKKISLNLIYLNYLTKWTNFKIEYKLFFNTYMRSHIKILILKDLCGIEILIILFTF